MKENYNATPGPWKQSPGFMIEGANGDYVCRVDASEGKSHFANAQLIASAPELLGALEWFVEFAAQHPEWMENFLAHEDSAEREWFNAVRQAIAKAKGGV